MQVPSTFRACDPSVASNWSFDILAMIIYLFASSANCISCNIRTNTEYRHIRTAEQYCTREIRMIMKNLCCTVEFAYIGNSPKSAPLFCPNSYLLHVFLFRYNGGSPISKFFLGGGGGGVDPPQTAIVWGPGLLRGRPGRRPSAPTRAAGRRALRASTRDPQV